MDMTRVRTILQPTNHAVVGRDNAMVAYEHRTYTTALLSSQQRIRSQYTDVQYNTTTKLHYIIESIQKQRIVPYCKADQNTYEQCDH